MVKKLFGNLFLFILIVLSVVSSAAVRIMTDSYLWGFVALIVSVLFFGGILRIIDMIIKKNKKDISDKSKDEDRIDN